MRRGGVKAASPSVWVQSPRAKGWVLINAKEAEGRVDERRGGRKGSESGCSGSRRGSGQWRERVGDQDVSRRGRTLVAEAAAAEHALSHCTRHDDKSAPEFDKGGQKQTHWD